MSFDPETLRPDEAHYHFVPYNNSPKGRGRTFIQYFYKDLNGDIFETVARNVETAEQERNRWLARRAIAAATRRAAALRAGDLHHKGMVIL